MPELPEVETTVRGLAAVLDGERLVRVQPRRPDLRRPLPEDLGQRMTGARVTGLGRRAKYGLIHTDRGDTLIFHLGMSGRWRIAPQNIGTHDHLVIETVRGLTVSLNDPRRFGSLDLVRTDVLEDFPAFAAMGPEPLGEAFDADVLARAAGGRVTPIKTLLLDQRTVAGLGNIYVCEALFRAGISPKRAAGRISRVRFVRLAAEIKAVLAEAILAGGSTLRDYARPDGELGYFTKAWQVYGREGQACRCGRPVLRIVQSGRSTFYCSVCQK